ncbi:MAG TPA: PEP/pyruvate-binding domain-containing protein [Oryzihumus sp.]|nr:PEP/pyruvate-binding domain-containing protein [Oryzihumus sp.]
MTEQPYVDALVVDLRTLDRHMLDTVGGKAANLGELMRAGLAVPPGFCVTTTAYARATADADLVAVATALAGLDPADAAGAAEHAARAREVVLAAGMPDQVAEAVSAAYQALPDGPDVPVAVRSSATAEDLPTASFAGQQDTFLNVVGTSAVLEAVRRCWASLWTDRAVAYRQVNGIDHASVRLAVVVQRIVDATVAGVLFTADPVSGARQRAVIEASPGLGEAVVSGTVNPDRFVVDTATCTVVGRTLGDKRHVVRSRPGGGTAHLTLPAADTVACLDDQQACHLARLGLQVQDHFAAPQDIEWAVDGSGQVWLVQSRPITTLFPVPITRSRDGSPLRLFFCMSLAQGLHRPLTPMGLSAFNVLGAAVGDIAGIHTPDPVQGPVAVTPTADRLFLDVTDLVRHPVGRRVFPRVLDVMESRSAVALRSALEDPRLPPRRGGRLRFAARLGRVMVRFRMPVVAVQAGLRPSSAGRRAGRLEAAARWRRGPREPASARERLEWVIRHLEGQVVPPLPAIAPAAAAGFAMFELARRLLGQDARPGDMQTVLRGLPHNVTTEMDLSLWDVAARTRLEGSATTTVRDGEVGDLVSAFRAGTLPQVVQRGLESFLERYGARAVAEIDLGMPRWRDDPGHLLGVLANYLRLPDGAPDPHSEFLRASMEAETMVDTLSRRAGRRGRVRGATVAFALRRARELAGLREMPKFLLVLGLAPARAQLLQVGEHLASTGRLAEAEDVFFLDLADVRAALDGADVRQVIRRRRETYDLELGRRRVPRLLWSDGTEPGQEPPPSADGRLRGTPASPGAVTARARIVQDPAHAHLEPGEILVAPSTDPGWTPLFLTAGGLVMEMGGANSHGAVVAREYGIPAVVGVPDATSRLTTGARVHVDGTHGVVTPE